VPNSAGGRWTGRPRIRTSRSRGERPELVRKPHELLTRARDGKIELAVSDAILDEFSRILHDKFEWSADRLNSMRAEVATFTKRVSSTETVDVVKADPDDNRILECAVAAGSDVIVTGDAHLLQLGTYRGVKITNVADFLGRARDR
jgi:putative PIN family toxin of toxin-antitoxin system